MNVVLHSLKTAKLDECSTTFTYFFRYKKVRILARTKVRTILLL